MSNPAHAPLPAATPVQQHEAKHVIVIGAGIIGLCSALWLQRLGHRVSIVDPLPPAPDTSYEHACSYGNACTIAHHGCVPVATPGIAWRVPGMLLNPSGPLAISWRYLPRLMPWVLQFLRASSATEVERIAGVLGGLLRYTNDAYAPLIADANASSLLRHDGCLYLYKTDKEFRLAQREVELRRRNHVAMDVLDTDAIRDLEPQLAPLYRHGVLFKDAYTLDSPHRFVLALADAIRARGGQFIRAEANGLTPGAAGVSVATGTAVYHADTVVVACGAWSRKMTTQMGDRVPLDTERGYHLFFADAGNLLRRPVCYAEHGFYMTPVAGGVRAAGTVEFGGLHRTINPVRTQAISRAAKRLLPSLGEPASEWLGFRPSMPDSLPVIGPSPHDRRVVYAFGHGHLGLTLGGITGRLVADIVSGRPSSLDLSALRPNRFTLF
jgi:glycine/D-amino acid oxidase-like deaminating enzyme